MCVSYHNTLEPRRVHTLDYQSRKIDFLAIPRLAEKHTRYSWWEHQTDSPDKSQFVHMEEAHHYLRLELPSNLAGPGVVVFLNF